MPSYGFTAHSRALPKRQFSTIHVFDLRVLCDTRSSVSDKISAMVNMSDTILHEFMHSTSYGKTVDELEPYVEDEVRSSG
ncbi:hypothetical protein F4778DRAFT_755279 [Xylariomycetidae sp. FL2044]|nr:hypothetical protein F4778DRAFT_755279 [Xylariomycetidae sp. FL2044]